MGDEVGELLDVTPMQERNDDAGNEQEREKPGAPVGESRSLSCSRSFLASLWCSPWLRQRRWSAAVPWRVELTARAVVAELEFSSKSRQLKIELSEVPDDPVLRRRSPWPVGITNGRAAFSD